MEDNHNQIMLMLGEIKSDVKGINARLDRVNGRLDKHDDALTILKVSDGKTEVKLGLWGALGGGAVALLANLFK